MSLATYSDLKTAIATWSWRSDLTSDVDDLIDLTEARLNRDLRLSIMQMLSNSGPSTEPNNLFAGVPNALLAGHHLTRGQEQEPFVVNGQVIDPRTMEVLGDFRDQPEGGLFSGSGVNAEALNAMVESGRMS